MAPINWFLFNAQCYVAARNIENSKWLVLLDEYASRCEGFADDLPGAKPSMKRVKQTDSDHVGFSSGASLGGKVSHYRRKQNIYTQGERAYTLLYIQEGGVRLTTRTKQRDYCRSGFEPCIRVGERWLRFFAPGMFCLADASSRMALISPPTRIAAPLR